MKVRNIIFTLIFASLGLISCNDYLDLVPEKDMPSIDKIFEKQNLALHFLNSCYNGLYPGRGDAMTDPAMCGSDEFMTGEFLKTESLAGRYVYVPSFRIAQGLQNPSNPILQIWGACSEPSMYGKDRYIVIRDCNTFIQRIDDVYDMSDDDKARYKAEVKALKALYYFDLIKQYGPIVLVPDNIFVGSSIKEMQKTRSHIDTCFNRVVKLFDEAIPFLKPQSSLSGIEGGHFTKEAAYAYKAKALCYAASPLFNGNKWYSNLTNTKGEKLFSLEYNKQKWLKAAQATEDAIKYCESTGKKLIDDNVGEKTELLNTIKNLQNAPIAHLMQSPEMIFGVWSDVVPLWKAKLARFNKKDPNFNSEISGCLSPTMRMIELYYSDKGLPIDMDKSYPFDTRYKLQKEKNTYYENVIKLNEEIVNINRNREPRFYADITGDKMYWINNDEDYMEIKPYRGDRHGNMQNRVITTEVQNLTGYWCKKLVPRDITNERILYCPTNIPFVCLRMADLYLLKAEAWNEYLDAPDNRVYDAINIVRERAGIPDVKESWHSYSKVPEKVDTKEGMRDIIRTERLIELAFEGQRFWDMRRWKIAHEYMNKPLKGWNVFADDAKAFYNFGNGPVIVWKKNKFTSPRDYLWPIKDEEVMISNVKQNIGW